MPRKPRQTITTITGLSHEGRGIAHIDGKTTFVFNALPGETVEIQFDKTRGSFNEAHTINVIEASAQRQSPACQYFGLCGGCALQHMPHHQQLSNKQLALQELLWQQARVQPLTWLPALTAHTLGYRRKARLSVKYVAAKGRVLVGFRERNGRYVANMASCQVLHPSVGLLIDPLSVLFLSLTIKEHIPQVEVAIGDHTTALIIRHLQPLATTDLDSIVSFAKQHNLEIYLQPQGADSIHPLHPLPPTPLSYDITELNLTLEFKPHQFTQVNAEINRKMILQALDLLELQPTDRVLDLFCGIGNFSLSIAKNCQHLIGIEGDPSAISQANHNAKMNNISNCDFYCANLFENDYNDHDWARLKYHKVLLDPPRAGAKEVIAQLNRWQPERLVYISCNPATLARDAALILQQGYELLTAGIMDMFPHTQHLEAMSLFVNKNHAP